jgi:hypothetical protein
MSTVNHHSQRHTNLSLKSLLVVLPRHPTLSAQELRSAPPSSSESSVIATQLLPQSNDEAQYALICDILQQAEDLANATEYLFDENTIVDRRQE